MTQRRVFHTLSARWLCKHVGVTCYACVTPVHLIRRLFIFFYSFFFFVMNSRTRQSRPLDSAGSRCGATNDIFRFLPDRICASILAFFFLTSPCIINESAETNALHHRAKTSSVLLLIAFRTRTRYTFEANFILSPWSGKVHYYISFVLAAKEEQKNKWLKQAQ